MNRSRCSKQRTGAVLACVVFYLASGGPGVSAEVETDHLNPSPGTLPPGSCEQHSECPLAALAAGSPPTSSAVAVDLSSHLDSFHLDSTVLSGASSVVISAGGAQRTLVASEHVTAAEFVAALQIATGGVQTLHLDEVGRATGGTFDLSLFGTQMLANLVVPAGVTALAHMEELNVVGALSTAGTILGPGSGTINQLDISAGSVHVAPGGSITTVVPSGLGLPAGGLVDLSISSLSDIFNSGILSASGMLTLSAFGSIYNQLPDGAAPGTPAPSVYGAAGLNVFATSGEIHNAGVMNAGAGALNISVPAASNMLLNNVGGTLLSTDTIQVRDALFGAKALTQISGGILSAPAINVFGGDGAVHVDANLLEGALNVSGGTANILARGGELNIQTLNLTGDPVLANSEGPISVGADLIFPGQDLAILAKGGVFVFGDVDLSSTSGRGGDFFVVAGFDFSPPTGGQILDGTSTFTIGSPSGLGGDVLISSGIVKTSSTADRAGDVTVVAKDDSLGSGFGTVSLPAVDASSTLGRGGEPHRDRPERHNCWRRC